MAQIVSRGGPRNLPPGVVTVAELLSRNQRPAEPAEGSPISVGSLLRREGRGPHSLDRPLQPRGTQQGRAAAGSGSKRVRRTVVAAGTFLAAGSVFGAAIVSDPAGNLGDQGALEGIFPTQPAGPTGAAPASGTAAIVDAAQRGPGGLDPGTAWSNVAYPRAASSAPAAGKAAAGSATPVGRRASNPVAGGTSGGTRGSGSSGGTQTSGGTGSTGGSSSGGSTAGSSGSGASNPGHGSGSGSPSVTDPVAKVVDGTGKTVAKTTGDVGKVLDETTGGVGKALDETTGAVGGLLGNTTGAVGKGLGLGFGGSTSDEPARSAAPRAGKTVNDQVDAIVAPVGKLAGDSVGKVGSLTGDSLSTVGSLTGDSLDAVDEVGAVDELTDVDEVGAVGEVVEGTVGGVDKVLGTFLTGDASTAEPTEADDTDDTDAEKGDEPARSTAERHKSRDRSTGDNPALSTLDDPVLKKVEKRAEPTRSSAKKHRSEARKTGDNPALSTLDDPVLKTVEKAGRHATMLLDQ